MDAGDKDCFTEGGASGRTLPPGLTEQEAEELKLELKKVEDEIQTLRHVLTAKERHAGELRRRLGISPLDEVKSSLTKGWHDVQTSNVYMKTSQTLGDMNQRITSSNVYLTASATLEDISHSDAYKKTQEALSQAGEMTSSAFSSLGSAIRGKLGDMRNSPTFKTLEEKMLKEARMMKKRNRHLEIQVLNRKHSFITKADLCDPDYPKSFKALC